AKARRLPAVTPGTADPQDEAARSQQAPAVGRAVPAQGVLRVRGYAVARPAAHGLARSGANQAQGDVRPPAGAEAVANPRGRVEVRRLRGEAGVREAEAARWRDARGIDDAKSLRCRAAAAVARTQDG